MGKLNSLSKQVKFHLKNAKNDRATIFASFNFGFIEDGRYRNLQQSTGISIKIDAWDKVNQRIIKDSMPKWAGLNRKLNDIENKIIDAYEELKQNNSEITPESIKNYNKEDLIRKPLPKITLIGFTENYIKTCGKNWKTTRHYKTTLNWLNKYSKSRRIKINFIDIDESFYNDFIKFLEGKNLRINTIGGHIKNLKVFLRRSYLQKIHTNNYFEHPDFKVMWEDVDSIYLSKEELIRIYNLDLSMRKSLEETRDGFLLSAFTGLRYSDLENLKPENILEDGTIQTTVIKTKKTVCLPVGSIVKAILNKYSPYLPRIISNQKFNNNLKIIAKLAKMNDWVTITRSNGGVYSVKKALKYWLVSSHSARRSYATNMAMAGVPIAEIMLTTGHKTERAFWKYVQIRPKENAKKLINISFLNFE